MSLDSAPGHRQSRCGIVVFRRLTAQSKAVGTAAPCPPSGNGAPGTDECVVPRHCPGCFAMAPATLGDADGPWTAPGSGSVIMVCMSEIQGLRVRFPNKRQAAGLGILGLVLSAGLLTGCSVFQDYSGDTCDGRKPVESLEQAGKDLVAAAYAADRDGVMPGHSCIPRCGSG